ncbi:hypothetical protein RRG08_059627 [Elysia crispata]|uniref:Uncharacterized protein n=1 Tax=Elysia crispata TaxID=231223 RepID=A0AAE0YSL1_9GAST|nr:hypothetical protein RRG08_059627 [Elysia crispata]
MVAVVNLGEKNKKYVAMSASLARKHADVIANVKRVISSALNIAVSRGVIRDALEHWNVNTHVQRENENDAKVGFNREISEEIPLDKTTGNDNLTALCVFQLPLFRPPAIAEGKQEDCSSFFALPKFVGLGTNFDTWYAIGAHTGVRRQRTKAHEDTELRP